MAISMVRIRGVIKPPEQTGQLAGIVNATLGGKQMQYRRIVPPQYRQKRGEQPPDCGHRKWLQCLMFVCLTFYDLRDDLIGCAVDIDHDGALVRRRLFEHGELAVE